MIVRKRIPTYETVQWTGSNLAACTEFVEDRLPSQVTSLSVTTIVDPPDNVNTFQASGLMFGVTARLDHHIVYGPIYGDDRAGAHFVVEEPTVMPTRYEEV